MYKKILCFLFLMIFSTSFSVTTTELYKNMNLEGKITYETFTTAIAGYNKIKNKKENLLIIIDYTKLSIEKRFFILDLKNHKIAHETLVSHGKNSGTNKTLVFSNSMNSYQSQLGFFKTLFSYEGKYGFSLRLEGLEEGINSNTQSRAIVIHGADYVSEEFIKKYGFLGRSEGCPALPLETIETIIPTITNGVVLYINGDDQEYFEKTIFSKL